METLDLNINYYELSDILKIFNKKKKFKEKK